MSGDVGDSVLLGIPYIVGNLHNRKILQNLWLNCDLKRFPPVFWNWSTPQTQFTVNSNNVITVSTITAVNEVAKEVIDNNEGPSEVEPPVAPSVVNQTHCLLAVLFLT